MECTYNETTKKFKLIYFDALKQYKGDKYPYGRKQETWKGSKQPTKKEQAATIARLLEVGKAMEEHQQAEVDKLKQQYVVKVGNEMVEEDNTNGYVNAVRYFMGLTPQDLTKGKVSSRHTVFLEKFTEFLKKNYPLTPLHEIKKPHFTEYFDSIAKYSTDVQEHHFFYLAKLWRDILDKYEETPVKYVNTLDKYGKNEFIKEKLQFERMPYTMQELKQVLYKAVNSIKGTADIWYKADDVDKAANIELYTMLKQQRFFVLYFCMVTGWRIGDVLNLKWEQVDMEKRTITLTHSKTKEKTGHETVLFITPLMQRMLTMQLELGKKFPYNVGYVFNIRGHYKNYAKMSLWGHRLMKFISKVMPSKTETTELGNELKKHTVHSIRKSVTTELHLCKAFTGERIKYLLGHADNSTEAQHYLKFKMYPERSTRDMVEHMEEMIDAEAMFNVVTLGWYGAEQKTDEVQQLTKNEVEHMKQNFWTTEAVECLQLLLKKGFTKTRLEGFIIQMEKERHAEGRREITEVDVTTSIKKFFDEMRVNLEL